MKIDSSATYLYSSQRMQPSNGARSAASSFPTSSRTAEESAYVREHDKRFAEIAASGKGSGELTADEVSYMQKAGGLVNTFAYLSASEKALYDEAVASGDTQAAAGLSQIALTRFGGHMAGGANGTTYDPTNTEITVANIEKYFRHSIVDPSGEAASNFQALMRFLQNNPAAT